MERRQCIRQKVNFEVLVSTQSKDQFILQASDISDHGIYVLSENMQRQPIGTVVQVKLNGFRCKDKDYPLLDMIIKRSDRQGMGMQYLRLHKN
jgi:hypothetical protein